MSRPLWFGLIAALVSLTGCFTGARQLTPPTTPAAAASSKRPEPVTAEHITPENAHEKFAAAIAEVDWDLQQALLNPRR